MIPKLIHQTAKTSVVSPKWAPFQKALLKFHPDWTYKLWNDLDNEALLRDRRPELVSVYQGMTNPAMRADLMRYLYMELFGGMYLDLDYQFLKPFDLTDKSLVLPSENFDGQPVYLGNCIFASEPGHPFWTTLIETIRLNPPTKETVKTEQDTIDQSGPGIVTRVWHDHFRDDKTIFITPRLWFHPVTPRSDKELSEVLTRPETYGIHWCFGSWRDLTLWSKIRRRIKNYWGSNHG